MDFDLVIAGMGPVGVVAANLAGQFGLKTLVADKSLTVFDKPRAMGFDHEIMRVLGNLGIAEKIADHVMPYRPSEYRTTDGRLIRRIDAASEPYPLGWAPNYVFLQPQVESALRDNLARHASVSVELGAEVLDVVCDGAGATTAIRLASGEEKRYRSSYVLACDGGTSPIRTQLGLEMEDLDFDEPWLVVDVVLKDGGGANLPPTNVQYCEIERPATFVVGPGQVRRWEFMINPGEVPADVAQPEFVRKLISRWLQPSEYEIWRASTYRFHALVLKQWRADNIFFLGDAAHMTPPFLAQGMCQGIRDAANLIWKIALVIDGFADRRLLDTYEAERAPHVRQTTLVTKGLGKDICERDVVRAKVRDDRLLADLQINPAGTVRQSLIPGLSEGFLSTSGVGPRGALFPQPHVRDAAGTEALLDEFTGAGFRVVANGMLDPAALEQLAEICTELKHVPVDLVAVVPQGADVAGKSGVYQDVNGVLLGWMERHGCGLAVIRPDHYVFGAARDAQAGVTLVRELARALQGVREETVGEAYPIHG
ncbi:bifunctional 3-(3-hydroxy-phenyl)propionate/3-hydroxycinnamic acid hydroxylase [Paraburkholderia sp. HD33-4]|uniref:bifunctional 3-(3-hydroxy-phenyl)propionate/3-hydroxycinnamic acid hydroxylase n=1 Tax=Paraburkholderia sp. HD33-4 TaxID=2883242 RepID=UPI001F1883D4|nr:bifunctional 3-(3-hydroxy-phenyl)propionate/3-hydroxycinnamic acid hydroxylase [Paraburkholderia sp. HD33-4]